MWAINDVTLTYFSLQLIYYMGCVVQTVFCKQAVTKEIVLFAYNTGNIIIDCNTVHTAKECGL